MLVGLKLINIILTNNIDDIYIELIQGWESSVLRLGQTRASRAPTECPTLIMCTISAVYS